MRAIRWSGEGDRYFGPFTFARDGRYRPFTAMLSSGKGADADYDNERLTSLRLSGFGCTLIAALPAWFVKPDCKWVDTSHYDWSGPGRGYWEYRRREFGFTLNDGYLSVSYGRSTMDSSTEQRRGYFLPWTQWRHVRRSFYDLNGEHFATLPDAGKSYLGDPGRWDRERAIEESCPAVSFLFRDYDGEELTATTKIGEREWRFGTGKFKWLSLFRKPKIRRSLDISFSGETGRRKGSWKGGTTGTGIDMLTGELHESAFRRYCAENSMVFIAQGTPTRSAETTGSVAEGDGGPVRQDAPNPSPEQSS